MKTRQTRTNRTLRRPMRQLAPGTRVRRTNGQRGRIEMVFSYRPDGTVRDYLIQTARGIAFWTTGQLHLGW